MTGKYSRTRLLQRIEKLEAQLTDCSGLAPDSPEWLAYWQEQVELHVAGKEHAPLTLEGVRAFMQAVPDDYDWNDADEAPLDAPGSNQ